MRALIPLSVGDTGQSVADLHEALDVLEVGGPMTNDERTAQRYGDGTREAVALLQARYDWSDLTVGSFDEACAARTNQLLSQRGDIDIVDDGNAAPPVLWERFQAGGPGSASERSDVAALSRHPANLEAWWTRPDNTVQGGYWYDDGKGWQTPYLVPGPKTSPNSGIASVSRKEDTMETWRIAADQSVRGAFWYQAGGKPWQEYRDPVAAGQDRASPQSGMTAVSRGPNFQEVWWVGQDGFVRGAWYDDGAKTWHTYGNVSSKKAASSSGLASVSRFTDNMEFWWVGEGGSVEGAYWYRDGKPWREYPKQVAPQGSAAAGSHNLAAVTRTPTSMDLFWISPEGALRWAYWRDGDEWQLSPDKVADDNSVSPQGGIAAITRSSTSMELFWIGQDGSVQSAEWNETTGWILSTAPVAVKDSAATTSGIAATRRTATTTEIFWVKTGGSVEVAIRDDANLPFSFRMFRPDDLLNLRCDVVGCRLETGGTTAPVIQYKVKSGETLWAIAEKYYGDGNLFTLIAAANKLPDANLIRAGDVLIIPPKPGPPGPPDTYIVVPNDKLWTIAERFYGDGNKYRIIADANHIADPDLIVPGQKLLIPRLSLPPDSQTRLVAVAEAAHIVVHFGVQSIFEQTFPSGSPAAGTAKARAANESRVAFELPKGTLIPFTVPGVLEGLTKLGLRVSSLAVPQPTDASPRPSDAKGKPAPPKDDETAIEAPYRLVVSPDRQYGGFTHAAEAAAAPGDPSRVELWHTRLGVRVVDEHGLFVRVDEKERDLRTVRAVWSRDEKGFEAPDTGFEGPLAPMERRAIVRQSADPTQEDAKLKGQLVEPNPLSVDRFYLSSLGSWIDWRVGWDSTRYKRPKGEIKLDAYRHLATVGRDHYVRIEIPVYLYPFDQHGTLVLLTERKIDLDINQAAYLYKRKFIVLREPIRNYEKAELQLDAQTKAAALNQLPFTSTSVDPIVSPDFDPDSVYLDKPFVPMVKKKPYRWKVTGTDHVGRQISMMTALVVVPVDIPAYIDATDTWFKQVMQYAEDKHPIDLGGAEVALAPSLEAGDTTARVQGMEFFAQSEPDKCTPWMQKAEITIPALAALNRNGGPVAVRWTTKYTRYGFRDQDKGQLFVTLDDEAKLDFAGSSDRGGGFVEPTSSVKAISRKFGGVGDNGSPDGIDGGIYDPTKFLGSALPKLFGLIDLIDILAKGGVAETPKLIAEQFDFVKTIEKECLNLTGALQQAHGMFDSDRSIPDAPDGARLRAQTLFDLTTPAIKALSEAPVKQLLDGLRATPPSPADAAKVVTALSPVTTLLNNAFLPVFVRAVLERPYRALNTALQTVQNATDLAKALLSPVANNTVRYEWFPTITKWPNDEAKAIFHPNDPDPHLAIAVEVRTSTDGKPQADVSAQIHNFELRLLPGDIELLLMKFGRIGFRVATGGKPEVDVQFNGMEFLGVLGFVEKLRQIIPFDGFSDPPYVDVDSGSATAGFDLALPSVAIGVFSLENIALGADCRVPFLGEAVTAGFYFCKKEAPFRLTVMAIGGGGWVGVRLAPDGLVLLEMGLEAGASLSVDLGVASGSVSVMIGVYLRLEDKVGQLTGYFRIRGEVEVLGIASASITLELSLTYHFDSGKLIGRASLQVEIEVAFFSASVEITCERKLAGSRGDPSLRDIMPPDHGGQAMWDEYFGQFAITGD